MSQLIMLISSFISKNSSNNIIQFRNKNKDVYFNLPNSKKRMLTVPEGEDGYDAVKAYFETEEGETIYNKLCRELD